MYLNPKVSENGSYPALQSLPADGLLLFPDKFLPVFYPSDKRVSGFVTITDDGSAVTSCAWNEEAYQKWCSENPEPDYLAEAKANKEAEISSSCNAAIVAGMDVETTQGTEHFSLQETDQINLTTAYNVTPCSLGHPNTPTMPTDSFAACSPRRKSQRSPTRLSLTSCTTPLFVTTC